MQEILNFPTSLIEIGELINSKPDTWCFSDSKTICTSIQTVLPTKDLELVSGLFTPKTNIYKHYWLQVSNTIIDPVRFTLTNFPPTLYIGPNDFYDPFGFNFHTSKLPKENFITDKQVKLTEEQYESISLFDLPNPCPFTLLYNLAHTPPYNRELFKPIYKTLFEIGLKSLIPLDNWNYVFNNIQKEYKYILNASQ